MTDEERIHPQLESALSGLSTPKADPEFRARLKRAFVSGEFESVESEAPATLRPVERADGRGAAPVRRRRGPAPILAILAAAAALLFVFGGRLFAPTTLGWEVVGGEGLVVTDSGEQAINASGAQLLPVGSRVKTGPGQSLRLAFDGYLFLEIEGDSAVDLDSQASLQIGRRRFELEADRGGLYVSTGPRFDGSCLWIDTPHLDLECIGTIFAVDVLEGEEDSGTCVCCIDGKVQVKRADPTPVSAGQGFFKHPGTAGVSMPEPPADHMVALQRFRELGRAYWAEYERR